MLRDDAAACPRHSRCGLELVDEDGDDKAASRAFRTMTGRKSPITKRTCLSSQLVRDQIAVKSRHEALQVVSLQQLKRSIECEFFE